MHSLQGRAFAVDSDPFLQKYQMIFAEDNTVGLLSDICKSPPNPIIELGVAPVRSHAGIRNMRGRHNCLRHFAKEIPGQPDNRVCSQPPRDRCEPVLLARELEQYLPRGQGGGVKDDCLERFL